MAESEVQIKISNHYKNIYMVNVKKGRRFLEKSVLYTTKEGNYIILEENNELVDKSFAVTTEPTEVDEKLYKGAREVAHKFKSFYERHQMPAKITDRVK